MVSNTFILSENSCVILNNICTKQQACQSHHMTNQNSVDSDQPDSPESSCYLVFRNGEWQMPIDEEDMDYTQFKPKRASSPIPGNNSSVSFINAKYIFYLISI